ncbi:MAG: tRNA pseudouridine(54/55) synthase Pus10 [Candidatus Helarchaeota archaeon]
MIDIVKEILKNSNLCDNCLGRQFGLLGYGLDNKIRGNSIKNVLILESYENYINDETSKSDLELLKALAINGMSEFARNSLLKLGIEIEKTEKKCFLCEGIFEEEFLLEIVTKALKKIENLDFQNFLVGSIIKNEMIEREDTFRSKYNISWGEALKSELNRLIGIKIKEKIHKEPNYANPEIVILVKPDKKEVEININPLFISGKYRKLKRNIPQTKWLCRECHGEGCEECGGTGKRYATSVQELISEKILEITRGTESKFHGAGREDIDALMLGNGREFVIEIKEPQKRFFDLKILEDEINNYAKGKIRVDNLKISDKEKVRKIKAFAQISEKTYRAIAELEKSIPKSKLNEVEKYFTGITIKQRTPQRVLHRRADKIRIKKIFSLKMNIIDKNLLEIIVRTQGGTYIKELISGDEGRTKPSISELLNGSLVCKSLDVISVEEKLNLNPNSKLKIGKI